MSTKTDKKPPKSFEALLYEQASTAQFMLLGDTNHFDAKISQIATSPAALDALKKAGIKHMMVEHMVFEQPAFDALHDKTISKAQFVSLLDSSISVFSGGDISAQEKRKNETIKRAHINDAANLVVNGAARGIKTHAVDASEGGYDSLLENEISIKTYRRLIEMAQADPKFMVTKSLYNTSYEDVREDMKNDGSYQALSYKSKPRAERSAFENLMPFEQRMEMDHMTLAQRIFGAAKGEPSAVLYGNWHFAKLNDVDETLERLQAEQPQQPQNRTATHVINIFDKPNGRMTKETEHFCRDFNCSAQPNHINYYYRTQTTDRGNVGLRAEEALDNPAPSLKP